MRVEEADSFHEGDGVVGLRQNDPHEVENKRQVEQLERFLIRFGRGRIVLLRPSRCRCRVRKGVKESLKQVEEDEDASGIPHRRSLDAGSQPDLQHSAEDVTTSFGVRGGFGVGTGRSRRTANDVEHSLNNATMGEFEYLRLLAEREVCRVVRVEVATVWTNRGDGAEVTVDEGVALVEEGGGEEEKTGSGDDGGRREVRLADDLGASFEGDEVGGELTMVGAIEGKGKIRVGGGPSNEPVRRSGGQLRAAEKRKKMGETRQFPDISTSTSPSRTRKRSSGCVAAVFGGRRSAV
jgi:hypothetical protein